MHFLIIEEISHSDISGITTKAPYEVALMGERHVRIEISDFVMRTFVRARKESCGAACFFECGRVKTVFVLHCV